jgi:cytochrome c oxidase assembly protein subunit 15
MNKTRAIWLLIVSGMVVAMIVLGGLVRLTESGLSIVEWDVIMGVLPPLGRAAWEAEFAKYQQSPEYQKVNFDMTLEEYEFIYYMEYFHRLLGRVVGLVFVLPLFYWLARGRIKWKESFPYLLIGLGFAFQGWLGWYMVASGLVDRPEVSHFRLTAHLLSALALLGLAFWVGLDNLKGRASLRGAGERSPLIGIVWGLLVVLLAQITFGGLMAGLKAGHVSNTWPLMFGRFAPRGMFAAFEVWWENWVSNPVTVHFIHRWLAWGVAGLAVWLWVGARRAAAPPAARRGADWLAGFVTVQIALGVSVVLFNVPVALASLHQAAAVGIFLAALWVGHSLAAD